MMMLLCNIRRATGFTATRFPNGFILWLLLLFLSRRAFESGSGLAAFITWPFFRVSAYTPLPPSPLCHRGSLVFSCLSSFLFVCLSLCLFFCLSVSIFSLSLFLSVCLCVYFDFPSILLSMSVSLSFLLSLCVSVFPCFPSFLSVSLCSSISSSVFLYLLSLLISLPLCLCMSVFLSVRVSVCLVCLRGQFTLGLLTLGRG